MVMSNQSTKEYVKDQQDSGLSTKEIIAKLVSSGWTQEQAASALSSDPNSPPPPPPPPNQDTSPQKNHVEESMWSAFQNILTFISLAFFAGSLHTLWSLFINYWIPDSDKIFSYYSSFLLNPSLASLIVATPFFIFLFIITNKRYSENPNLKKTKSKKFLNYITLVITFLILITRLVSAVNKVLSSSLSANFALNLLVTLLITGTIFAYYLFEVRLEKKVSSYKRIIFASIIIAMISITTLVIAFPIRSAMKIESEKLKEEQRLTAEERRSVADTKNQLNRTQPPPTPMNEVITETITFQGIIIRVKEATFNKTQNGDLELELDMLFTAIGPCNNEGQSDCVIDVNQISITDDKGIELKSIYKPNNGSFITKKLNQQEQSSGKLFYPVETQAPKYYLTYEGFFGNKSDILEINPK